MNDDNNAIQPDRKVKSFRVSDFTLRDLPWGLVGFLALSVFAVGLGSLAEFLPASIRWVGLGLAVGFCLGFVAASWCPRSARQTGDSPRTSPSNK